MNDVGIVDYGVGNLLSLTNALEYLGIGVSIISDPLEIENYKKLILPGVGSFPAAMDKLEAKGMIEPLEQSFHGGSYILGICLGFQLFAQFSSEGEKRSGLGWVQASVEKIESVEFIKIPHVGWNSVKKIEGHQIIENIEEGQDFYFVHSYRMVPTKVPDFQTVLTCDYGVNFVAAIAKNNLFGVQFHPEKSQEAGLKLLKTWYEFI